MNQRAPRFLLPSVSTRNLVRRILIAALALAAMAILTWPGFTSITKPAAAQDQGSTQPSTPDLGAAIHFAVLSQAGLTNTGDTQVTGDVGVSSGATVTGLPPEAVRGKIWAGDAVAQGQRASESEAQSPGTSNQLETNDPDVLAQARHDLASAYKAIAALPSTELDSAELSGRTLTPGVYSVPSGAQLTAQLTLDAQDDPSALFIFKVEGTLTTEEGSNIALINGAQASNVFFQVSESADLGANSEFNGNLLARDSVTMQPGGRLTGRVLALEGKVMMSRVIIIVPAGFLQICKAADSSGGEVTGTFVFTCGSQVIARVTPGFCSFPILVPAGNITIHEELLGGFRPVSVTANTLPAPGQNRLVGTNLAAGLATVTVVMGNISNETVVTFTNRKVEERGTLKICKLGASTAVTGSFSFSFGPMGGSTSTVSIPVNECFIDGTFPVGTVVNLTETARAGFEVSDILVSDNRAVPGSRNLSARSISATIGSGVTEVIFVNRPVTPSTGFLQVCKNGTISADSGPFTFSVAGQTFSVLPGFCTPAIELPVGNVTITETARDGFTLANVMAGTFPLPGENRLVSTNLAAGTATVTVAPGGVSNETIAVFTNRKVEAERGTLKICKLGASSAVTGSFSFSFGPMGGSTSTVSIPVNECFIDGTFPVGTVINLTETARAGFEVSDILVSDNRAVPGSRNLTARSISVTIGSGVTEVVFVNRAVTAATGFLQVCKNGTISTSSGPFTFSVAGQTFSVLPGFCTPAIELPVGNVTITEAARAGFALADVFASTFPLPGVNRLVSANLGAGTATVRIEGGGTSNETVAIFTNRIVTTERGTLKICKLGASMAVTGSFGFSFGPMGGSSSMVSIPVNACFIDGTFPVGTVVNVTEMARAGFEVSDIQVSDGRAVPGSRNLTTRSINATIGSGVTEVVFVNRKTP